MGHTEGEWKFTKKDGPSWEIWSERAWIASVYMGYGQKSPEETEANANLIAAAPKLKKALGTIMKKADHALHLNDAGRSQALNLIGIIADDALAEAGKE